MGLGSGIRKKPIPDPGVKKAPDPGSGSATLVERYRIQFQRSVVSAGCALLIRRRFYTVQFWRISKSGILLDWSLWFFPPLPLSFSFLCRDVLRTPLTLFSGALRPAGIRGSIRVFCGGRWRHTHGKKYSCLYCWPVLGIRIRVFFGLPCTHASGSVSHKYGSGSRSLPYRQAKIVWKTFISTVL